MPAPPRVITTFDERVFEPYDGLLFDCDGTLADTMPLHFEAWRKTLEPRGVTFTRERYMALAGMPTGEILRLLAGEQGIPLDFDALLPEKEGHFLSQAHLARPIERVVALARSARGTRPMAVVSGGVRRAVERTLQTLGIHGWFCAIITAEDTRAGKPDPAPFLLAAERIGADASRCLVFEDGELGIESAQRAGMDVVDVRGTGA
jgi:beta-phosphoglucomutase-like phosphatase (HAD superfamily)